MEHKRDADAAGLVWPQSSTRTSLSSSVPEDTSSLASSSNPVPLETTTVPETVVSPPTGDVSMMPSGMYAPDPHPETPFPVPEHRHQTAYPQGRFSERLVHQIHFKIFTHADNTQELLVEEIPTTGISRTRDPEHFFYAMSGQWEWSKCTSDYWHHHFGLPIKTISWRTLSCLALQHRSRPLPPWPHSCTNVYRKPWHLGKLASIGAWLNAWSFRTRFRPSWRHRVLLLRKMTDGLYRKGLMLSFVKLYVLRQRYDVSCCFSSRMMIS